jgi:rhodanese-related sulfurtransferase
MPTPIDRERAQQLIGAGAQLIEVLPPAEYEDEHLPGAITSRSRSSTARRPVSSSASGR